MLVALCSAAEAQHPTKTPLIGFIPFSGDPTNPGPAVQAFRGRLRELGYEEGRSIMVEYRYPLGRLNQMPSLVEELIRLKVNVLVVGPQSAISAAKKITKTTPIVMISSIDPVAAGHIASLSRPGGNVTGMSQLTRDLSSKRVELLKEVIPDMRRVAILWDLQGPGPKVAF